MDHGAGFSVVVPTRDRCAGVLAQVRRLQAMAQGPDAIVVADDGSTDGTAAALAALADPPVVVRCDGVGPASARNRGVAETSTEWLVFLDDDDLPDPEWMAGFRALVAQHPRARFVSRGLRYQHGDDVDLAPRQRLGPAFGSVQASYLAGTFAVRRDVFDAVGGFLEDLRVMEFTDLAMRIFAHLDGDDDGVAGDDVPCITVVRRPWADRSSQRPDDFVTGVRAVLANAGHLLGRDPSFLADTLATLGVAEVRSGAARDGRRNLLRAFRLAPWPPVHLVRAGISLVPPLRRRVWRQARSG